MEIDREEFLKNYNYAKAYHRRAGQFVEEGQRKSLIFNVASVALECYLIALCALNGRMPFNHNYTCLMDTLDGTFSFPVQLKNDILSLDDIFGICSLENYHHGMPQPEDAQRVIAMCDEVEKLFSNHEINDVINNDDAIKGRCNV
jgi:hypothetical protein